MEFTPIIYFIIFLYGITIGSFLNVCIYRIPLHENIITTRSHCTHCGYQLKWFDLFPIVSYIIYRGRCRKCSIKISFQYPIIELFNGLMYVWIFYIHGMNLISILYCLGLSALITLSVIDFRTYEIPFGINIFIGVLGIIRILYDRGNYIDYLIGFISVSGFLLIVDKITKGRGIGGGDIKLMAASGLLLGWQYNLLAFILGCIIGSVIHVIRMKISNEDRVLAFGPYLSAGIIITMLYGELILDWYLHKYI